MPTLPEVFAPNPIFGGRIARSRLTTMAAPLFLISFLGSLAVTQAAPDHLGGCAPDKLVAGSSLSSIRRIAVLGERHSGTNFMARLLTTNLDPTTYVYGDHFYPNR